MNTVDKRKNITNIQLLEEIKELYPKENDMDSLKFCIEKDLFRFTNMIMSDKFTVQRERIETLEEQIYRFHLYEQLIDKCLKLNYDFVTDIPQELVHAKL